MKDRNWEGEDVRERGRKRMIRKGEGEREGGVRQGREVGDRQTTSNNRVASLNVTNPPFCEHL